MEMRVKGMGVKRARTVTENEWMDKRVENIGVGLDVMCSCDNYRVSMCDCKGACNCHWKEIEVTKDGAVADVGGLQAGDCANTN